MMYRDQQMITLIQGAYGEIDTPLAVVVHNDPQNASNGLLYRRDPEVLKFHIPMPAQVFGPDVRTGGEKLTYYVRARTAGLEWRVPKAAVLIENISD